MKLLLTGAAFALATVIASADVVHNESESGELSSNRLAPTSLGTFAAGTHSVIGTSGGGDLEYFTFSLGSSVQLSALTLSSYVSADATAFIAVQAGSTFTEPSSGTTIANLLGYSHFGTSLLGTDILDNIGLGSGSIGFTAPLSGPTYTFWVQQLGASTNYQLDFTAIPEPGTYAAIFGAVALAGAVIFRRARREREGRCRLAGP